MAKIAKDHIDQYFNYRLFWPTKTYYLGDGPDSEIDAKIAEDTIKALHILDNTRPETPITLILNSSGGDTEQGMAIYDAIKSCNCEVHITVMGCAYSMAAYILQAADLRRITPNSKLMIHVGSYSLPDAHPEINKAWTEQYNKDEIMLENVLLDRIQEKLPAFYREQLRELSLFDKILQPSEALEYGLIDEIVLDK